MLMFLIASKTVRYSTAFDCDKGFQILNSSKVTNPVGLLIIDLSFRRQPPGRVLIDGQALMAKLLELKINIPRLVYSSHDEIRSVIKGRMGKGGGSFQKHKTLGR